MIRLYYIVKKELIEMSYDIGGIMVCIAMPTVFILVMSLSMQALFQSHSHFKIDVIVVDHDKSTESRNFMDIVKEIQHLNMLRLDSGTPVDTISKDIASGDHKFALIINKGFSSYIGDINKGPEHNPVSMITDPAVQLPQQLLVKYQLENEVARLKLTTFLNKNEEMIKLAGIKKENVIKSFDELIKPIYAYKDKQEVIIPSAAQQSVPSWMVFALYFIVIPIATIFIAERNNGTLTRFKSINISPGYLIFGKMFSYYIVGMFQIVFMLCMGRFIVPLLGGDTISLGNSYLGLYLIASCCSFNAISFGLLLSSASKNYMTIGAVGAVLNIILSAIGGVMIPKFVMPAFLQRLSYISPHSWGIDGFLAIMLRNGGVRDIIPDCIFLIITGAIMLAVAGVFIKKKIV